MMIPKRPKRRHIKRRRNRRITPLRMAGLLSLVAVLGFGGFLLAKSGGGNGSSQADMGDMSRTMMTPMPTAASAAATPYAGGGRLYLPVTGVDLGHVPLMTEVGYSFDLQNVGDKPLSVMSQPSVKTLEGC